MSDEPVDEGSFDEELARSAVVKQTDRLIESMNRLATAIEKATESWVAFAAAVPDPDVDKEHHACEKCGKDVSMFALICRHCGATFKR